MTRLLNLPGVLVEDSKETEDPLIFIYQIREENSGFPPLLLGNFPNNLAR